MYKLLRNTDKLKANTRKYSNRAHFLLPYIKQIHKTVSPHLSEDTNRIIDKGINVSEKIKDIADIITK
jgi:hypothetical protein